jgi:ATP-dependent Clp protease protease subunit
MQAQGDVAEILIYDVIGEDFWSGGGVTAKGFTEQLKALGDVKTINLKINSPGGDVFDGVAIYNNLVQHSAKVNVFIDGLAASIASVIAMAGDNITIAENGMMMIHNPWTLAMGDANDLRQSADVLDKIKATMLTTYSKRAGVTEAEASVIMDAETWYTGQEAVDAGFADDVQPVKAAKAAALFDLSVFKNAPKPKAEPAPAVDEGAEDFESLSRRMRLDLAAKAV